MLSRPFLTLALAMFAASMGIGMVSPVLPVHARDLGATPAQVALTFSAFAITQVLVSPFSGRLADRFGRKPFILLGLCAYIVASIGWMLTGDVLVTIALRALSGLGAALIFSLSTAYIGDLAPRGQEGRYMGAFGVFDFLGFGLGPLISGIIRDQAGFDAVFLSMASLMACALVAVGLLLPGRVRSASPGASGSTGVPEVPWSAAPWGVVLRDPLLQAAFVVNLGIALAFGAAFSFLAIYLEDTILATATMVGLVLAGQEVLGGALQPVFGPVADRVSRRLLVAVGSVMMAVGYITLAIADSYLVILLVFLAGAGVGSAIEHVAARAVLVHAGRRLGMATTMSLNSMAFGLGVLIGSLGGSRIAALAGVEMVFVASAGALLLGGLFFVVRTAGRPLSEPVLVESDGVVEAPRLAGAGGVDEPRKEPREEPQPEHPR